MTARKTWVSIVIAGMAIVFILVVAVIGGGAFWMRRHAHSEVTPPQVALAEIDKVHERFAGQLPLIELRIGDDPVVHRTPSAPRHEIQALHVIGFSSVSGKLSHVDLPGWLLRMMSAGGRFRIANLEMFDRDEDNRLTLEDLERHGPGLVLDAERRGGRALVWIE